MTRTNRELLEQIEERLNKMDAGPEAPTALLKAFRTSFEKRMYSFVLIMLFAFGLFSWISYEYVLQLFPIAFSGVFVFMILLLVLAIDEYVLPMETFKEITKNAIAVSVFWLSVVLLAVSGVRIGMSIISDPFSGERPAASYQIDAGVQGSPGAAAREQ